MRVLLLSGYSHPSYHRKVELLADAPEVEILHILPPDNGKAAGLHSSANGRRQYTVHVLPLRSLGQPGDPHRIYHWPPKFELTRFRPDIIHCEHEQEGLLAVQIALARWALSRRSQLILYSWQNILRQRRLPVRLLSQLTLRAAQHIFCASHEAITVLRRQGYRRGANVVPLFGLDTRYFFPRQANRLRTRLGLNGFGVGYVGRLVPEKGLETLLRAVAQTPARVQLLCVGDGPEQGRLQALAIQLGIADRCQFRDAVVYDQVAEYLNALDLLVLPSRTTRNWKEQFGRVLVETMACKVVVAGSDSGAIPEVVGDAGRIFPEGDANALAAIITELAADPALRQTLAERGYQRVMGNFTVERYAEVILEVWRKLAS